jgi:hypothetical protein
MMVSLLKDLAIALFLTSCGLWLSSARHVDDLKVIGVFAKRRDGS